MANTQRSVGVFSLVGSGGEDGWIKGLAVVLCSIAIHGLAVLLCQDTDQVAMPVSSGSFAAPVNLSFTRIVEAASVHQPAPKPQPKPEPQPKLAAKYERSKHAKSRVAQVPEPQPESKPEPHRQPTPASESAPEQVVASAVEQASQPGLDQVAVVTKPQFRQPPSPPGYPPRAQRRNQQGVVMVEALVDEQGEILKVAVIGSSGFPLLDSAALKAVARWQFQARRVGARAVRSRVQVPVAFRLNS